MSHEQSDDTTSAPKSSQPALSTPRKTAGSVAILMMLLAGCGVSEEASSRGATSEPVEGGTIVYGHDQEPPCLWGGWVQQAYISRSEEHTSELQSRGQLVCRRLLEYNK